MEQKVSPLVRISGAGAILFLALATAGSASAPDSAASTVPLPNATGTGSERGRPSDAALAPLFDDIRRSEYSFSPAAGASFSAPNRAQALRASLAANGLLVSQRTMDEAAWAFRLRLARVGREGAMDEVGAAERITSVGNRIEMERGDVALTEWYVNDARGIEQGFTIHQPPTTADGSDASIRDGTDGVESADAGPLILEMLHPPDLRAREEPDGRGIIFQTDGGPDLRYGGLEVVDASGRTLEARLRALPGRLQIHVDDRGASYPITIDPILTRADWSAQGGAPDTFFGFSVASAGDVDNDGFDDLIVGAPEFDGGLVDEGKVFVYRGGPSGPVLHWSAEGDLANAQFGFSVATAGHVNNDLYADIIVGAPFYSNGPAGEGWAFVYHGSATGLPVPPAPAWSAQSNQLDAHFGWSVASGDFNGGGFDDVLIGSPLYNNGQADEGVALLWYGSATGLGAPGTPLNPDWGAESNEVNAQLGYSVASAGNVNADPREDIIVGAPYREGGVGIDRGWAFLWYGSLAGPPGPSGTPLNASWSANSLQDNALFGLSVAAAGDINDDGFGDVIIGAPFADNGQADEGGAFVWLGSAGGLGAPGTPFNADWLAESDIAGSHLGSSVASAGDVNADGVDDVIVGAPEFPVAPLDNSGRVFAWLGSSAGADLGLNGIPANADWSVQGSVAGSRLGVSVAGAGDIDGDAWDDVIVGAYRYADPDADEGAAFVYRGLDPPDFLEFGPRGDPRRVEAPSTGYAFLQALVTGDYLITGSATVTMGTEIRPFGFADLTAVIDPNDPAGNGTPAFRIEAGSALIATPLDPIDWTGASDLDLHLYSFVLNPLGAESEPGSAPGGVRKGLWWLLPASLTSAAGSELPLPPVGVEQDLDFAMSLPVDASMYIAPKDYPFRIVPAGGLYAITRTQADLGDSFVLPIVPEQGDPVFVGGMVQPRCAPASLACFDESNDGLFRLGAATASSWDPDHFDGDPNIPAVSVPRPRVERGGLRATFRLDAAGAYRPFFPAGADVTLNVGSRLEFVDTEPAATSSLDGKLDFSWNSGAVEEETGIDCTATGARSATFTGAVVGSGGELRIATLTPLFGFAWDEISWAGDGGDPNEPVRGFFVDDLDPDHLSFFAPGSVARVDVQDHLIARMGGGSGEGTYAGVNVAKSALDGLPAMTTGLETACPGPDPNTGHSLTVPATKTRLYVRRSGVAGIADAGVLASRPFPFMGYNLTLDRFGASFLDNEPVDSGIRADDLVIPYYADITLDFAAESRVGIRECGSFGELGAMRNAGEPDVLAYWKAPFTPWAAEFLPQDDTCRGVPPPTCDIDPNDVLYVHIDSEAPLDLNPSDPNRTRFAEQVAMDFAPAPQGHLVCNAIVPGAEDGAVRNEFEPGLGFDVDISRATLYPLDPAAPERGDDDGRYEVTGEFLLPFFGATDLDTTVKEGLATVIPDFADPASFRIPVSRPVMAGLFDLDFNVVFKPALGSTPARFLASDAALDLRLFEIPAFVRLLGKGNPLDESLGLPEVSLGFLGDLGAYAEATEAGACGASCRDTLTQIGAFAGDADMDAMLPSLGAGLARLPGGVDLKSLAIQTMQEEVGSILPADIAQAASRVSGAIDGIRSGFEAFKTLQMTGPGSFVKVPDDAALPDAEEVSDFVLDAIGIDADIEIAEFIDFDGEVHFSRHTASSEDCDSTEEAVDVTVGARDVSLDWIIDGSRARLVEATLRFDPDPFRVWGFDGAVELEGISFGDVIIDEMGLFLGMGNDLVCGTGEYYYLGGSGRGRYKNVSAEAGFFLGKSIDIAPLERIDPDVGEVLVGLPSLTGVYARAGASFPILSGTECFPWRLTGGGAGSFWLFSEGPTFGTKLRAYATGTLVCAVHARADLTLLGGLTGDVWHLAGHGFAAGGVGYCEPDSWDNRRDVLRDDWCFACVLSGEFRTDSRRNDFEGTFDGPDCN